VVGPPAAAVGWQSQAAAAAGPADTAGLLMQQQQQGTGRSGSPLAAGSVLGSAPSPFRQAAAAAGGGISTAVTNSVTGSPQKPAAQPMATSLLPSAAGVMSAGTTAAMTAAAAAVKAVNVSCLCCYPPCLTEGVSTEAHVYVLGLEQLAAQANAAAAAAGVADAAAAAAAGTYRVVASFGSVIVADVRGVCRPQEGLFRSAHLLHPANLLHMCCIRVLVVHD
jgi:hypothetical protein